MDEQRIQAYVALLEQRLGCAVGQEYGTLPDHGAWVNVAALEEMRQVADWMEHQGRPHAAWLRQVAETLAEGMALAERELSGGPPREALNFVAAMLQKIAETNGDRTQVYRFWRTNLAGLNEHLIAALPMAFARVAQSDQPGAKEFVAGMFGEFGTLIQQFLLGDRRLNLEMAIAAYNLVLQVYTYENFPEQWAMTQNNLATAYSDRIQGDRAENIEAAIAAYQQALRVYTYEAFPEQWAMTQNNLATVYRDRIQGDRAKNIAAAIVAYQQALQVYTREHFTGQWTATQNQLAATNRELRPEEPTVLDFAP